MIYPKRLFFFKAFFISVSPLIFLLLQAFYLPHLHAQEKARVLDKILSVFDDKIQTLSQAQYVLETLRPRLEIAGPSSRYAKVKTLKDVSNLFLEGQMIKAKLSEMGQTITDEQVDSQIREFQKRQNISKEQVEAQLKSLKLSYDAYFQIIREIIEFGLFQARVIVPLLSVTEQEIKNEFFRRNLNNKTFTIRYELESYSVSEKNFQTNDLAHTKDLLKGAISSRILPTNFSLNELGTLTEDGLAPSVRDALKKISEGELSSPVLLSGEYHFFYVKKKDLIESEVLSSARETIQTSLYEEAAEKALTLWFAQEKNKHYIKVFL